MRRATVRSCERRFAPSSPSGGAPPSVVGCRMLRTRVRARPVSAMVLSLVGAIVLTIIQAGDLLIDSWQPDYDRPIHTSLRVPYGPRIVRDFSNGRPDIRFENFRVVVPPGTVLDRSREDHRAAHLYESLRRPPRPERLGGVFVIYFTLL